jgi:hypothetical protein
MGILWYNVGWNKRNLSLGIHLVCLIVPLFCGTHFIDAYKKHFYILIFGGIKNGKQVLLPLYRR